MPFNEDGLTLDYIDSTVRRIRIDASQSRILIYLHADIAARSTEWQIGSKTKLPIRFAFDPVEDLFDPNIAS